MVEFVPGSDISRKETNTPSPLEDAWEAFDRMAAVNASDSNPPPNHARPVFRKRSPKANGTAKSSR